VSGLSRARSKCKMSFVTPFVRVGFVWVILTSVVFFMCRGGWRYLVRMSLVLSCVPLPPILIYPSM
jgi:hypothetical protein